MIRVFENFDFSRVGQIQSLLESHGIPTFLKNQFASSVMGEVPFVEVCPQLFILDEADEMLSRGFIEQIYDIFQCIASDTQVGLISATMPNEVLELSKKFLRDPVHILVKKEELTLEGIKQFYVGLEKTSHKIDTLIDLFETISITQSIIFINKKRGQSCLFFSIYKCPIDGCCSSITGQQGTMQIKASLWCNRKQGFR